MDTTKFFFITKTKTALQRAARNNSTWNDLATKNTENWLQRLKRQREKSVLMQP